MPGKIPKYRARPDRGFAFVELGRRRVRLPGPIDSPESLAAYHRIVQQILESKASRAPYQPPTIQTGRTVADLVLAFLDHAQIRYRKHGRQTSEYHVMRSATQPLLDACGNVSVDSFGPLALEHVQRGMVAIGWSRQTINQAVGRVRRVFKWGVAKELVPAAVWQALTAVAPLREGSTAAHESEPITPVESWIVTATVPFVKRPIDAIIDWQRFTGCRPGNAVSVRPCEIDQSGDVWLWRPEDHKTMHRGRGLVIAVGPKAQAVIKPFLAALADNPTAFCFTPSRKQQGGRPTGRRYSVASYRRAITRAVDALNETAKEYAAGKRRKPPEPVPYWHPNQLRHSLATEARARFGLEAAQVILGHANADVTQIYAERDLVLAKEVARAIG